MRRWVFGAGALQVLASSAVICALAGALYYPQAGIINPAELAPIASIYLAVWVAIGGRGRLYGAVIGAVFVSLLSSWFTGGRAPSIPLGFGTLNWVDWWQVLLGVSFVAVTLFAARWARRHLAPAPANTPAAPRRTAGRTTRTAPPTANGRGAKKCICTFLK